MSVPGLILSLLDQTIVSTAMPTIIKELGGLSLYSWVFSVYMLTSTTSMPIYDKLADLFGRKKIYLLGLSIFLIGSVLCGLAGNMTELVIFRGLQGLGAGTLMPITFTIVADIYPREKIGKFQGLFGSIFALSSILGPALGGAIAEFSNRGWIFYMNLLLGIPAFFIMMAAFKESKSIEKRSIDWFGAITLSSAIILILLTLVLDGNSQGTGVSPFYAGYILTPLMIAVVISMNLGGRLMSKVSYRTILVPSLALIAVGFLLLSQMTVNTTKLQIYKCF